MKRRRMKVVGAAACLAALVAVALVIALPAGGTAPAGSAFFAKLDGENEVPDADPDGYGTFSGGFNGVRLCYGLQVYKIDAPLAAHIHKAPIGANGGIVVTLNKPATGTPTGQSGGCTNLTTTLAGQIKANPRAYYINVHTGPFPNGAVRGQLFQATATQGQ
jgi:hypothetical protein